MGLLPLTRGVLTTRWLFFSLPVTMCASTSYNPGIVFYFFHPNPEGTGLSTARVSSLRLLVSSALIYLIDGEFGRQVSVIKHFRDFASL